LWKLKFTNVVVTTRIIKYMTECLPV